VTPLVYVYAVLEGPVAGVLRGIDGATVHWIEEGGLAAAVSDVSSAEFEEEALNANVRDLSWLGPRAIAHDALNGALWERADALVPLAFGAVFRDAAGVRSMLESRANEFRERLGRVRGRGEWVIALHRADPSVTEASERVAALKAEIAAASAGRAHLLKRRLAELERDELYRLQAEAAAEFVREAQALVDGVYVEPIPAAALERPLVRATLLVPDGSTTIGALVRRWQERGYVVSESGPTPPYRFAALTV
jgi:hypothetical protein